MLGSSFLADYGRWLARNRWWIVGVVIAALLAFSAALFLTSEPQDPFSYEVF